MITTVDKTKDFKTKSEKCARDFIEFCLDNELWIDTFVYVNGKRFGCKGTDGHYHYDNTWDQVFVEDDMDPKKYMEYTSKFMTVSTEGPLYEIINGYDCSTTLLDNMEKVFDKYDMYFEQGDSWNFGLFKK